MYTSEIDPSTRPFDLVPLNSFVQVVKALTDDYEQHEILESNPNVVLGADHCEVRLSISIPSSALENSLGVYNPRNFSENHLLQNNLREIFAENLAKKSGLKKKEILPHVGISSDMGKYHDELTFYFFMIHQVPQVLGVRYNAIVSALEPFIEEMQEFFLNAPKYFALVEQHHLSRSKKVRSYSATNWVIARLDAH